MPYTKMRLEYFQLIETLLQYNVYIKMSLNEEKKTVIEVVEHSADGEIVLMASDSSKSLSDNLLDLIHEMSTRMNDGIPMFPQYAKTKMRRKTLDNVISLGYEIYFYKTFDDKVLSKITKEYTEDSQDIFISVGNTMKDAFELLDSEIYNRFGFYPDIRKDSKLDDYADNLVRNRRKDGMSF